MTKPSRAWLSSMVALMTLALSGLGAGALTVAASDEGSPTGEAAVPGEVITVIALDYRYDGLPTSVPAGTSFGLRNEGEEVHEMLLARRNVGTTQTWEELLALPDEEALALVTLVGALAALPGETSGSTVTVTEEGDYLAICYIPQFTRTMPEFPPFHPLASASAGEPEPDGAAAEAGTEPVADAPMGPPHFLMGQLQELTVTPEGTPRGPLPEPVS